MQIEKKLNEIEQFYSNNGKKQANNSKGKSGSKCKNNGKDRNAAHIRKEASASERMQNLIHKFGGIINEVDDFCVLVSMFICLKQIVLIILMYSLFANLEKVSYSH